MAVDWTLPKELERFLGLYNWKRQLCARDLYRLAVTRSFVTNDDVDQIALEHARVLFSSEYRYSLDETRDDGRQCALRLYRSEGGSPSLGCRA